MNRNCSAHSSSFFVFYYMAMMTISAGMFLVFYIIYEMFYPFTVLEVKKTPLSIVNNKVKAGETVSYVIDYCKKIDANADVDRSLVDSIIIHLPRVSSNTPTGCRKSIIPVIIPEKVPAGVYRLHVSLNYRLSPLREIKQAFDTEDFEVVQ